MRRLLLLVPVVLALAACTSSGKPHTTVITDPTTVVISRTNHTTADPKFTPKPAKTIAPLGPDQKPPKGEVRKSCPYLKGGLDSEPTSGPNVADIEGDRVGTITVLPGLEPVGCRFYFAYTYQPIADILPRTFRSARAAYDAMILTAKAGASAEPVRDFVKGVTGISYQTKFDGNDGAKDWAFVFAKGKVMVVVHTHQYNTSFNARALAKAIVGKF